MSQEETKEQYLYVEDKEDSLQLINQKHHADTEVSFILLWLCSKVILFTC